MTTSTAESDHRRAENLADWLTRQEVADYTGMAVQTFARWATEGKGPKMRKLGGRVRYAKADVLAWLDASES